MASIHQPYSAPVLVPKAGGVVSLERIPLVERDAGTFDEAWLQNLIHTTPSCLPIEEIEPGFERAIAICQEMPTKHGPIDNLLMTPEGDLVIVEAKLWRNPEARRRVVAQALDYASCLFEMDYAELEARALKGNFGNTKPPMRLYDLFADQEVKDEAAFIDSVNSNLRKGRALILVVGDGIRDETVRLASLLQSHAGARFTFGLIELALFRMPDGQGTMVCPRTLARTTMIERGVILIDDRRTIVLPPSEPVSPAKPGGAAKSISAEQFLEAMAELSPALPKQIEAFVARLESLGVYPEYLKSLNLKWDPPEGKAFNLGYVKRSGHIKTDAANWFGREELGHQYNEALASALGMLVDKENKNGWCLMNKDGRTPRIDEIALKFDAWYSVIESFLPKLIAYYERG